MSGPLHGVRILITRARAQAGEFCHRLQEAGATVVELPTIEIVEPEDWGPADRAIDRLGSYELAIFTSANGVDRFAARLRQRGLDMTALGGARVLAIGPATAAALREAGLGTSVPEEYRAEAVLEMARGILAGRAGKVQVLIPRALEAREVLPDGLRKLGARVDVVPVYRTVVPEGSAERLAGALDAGVDCVTFTSSSTVRNLLQLLPDGDPGPLDGVAIACIGPITADTARGTGLRVDIQPDRYTIEGLVEALVRHFG
ncbi:MAG: uroporphyrinogen-III synthase [Acidobacteriota bacterium]|jgi:uroporphyrinogen III methyltransferase/synthase